MAKTQSPALLLTDAERTALRKARITVRDLGEMRPEDVVEATKGKMSLEHARENCALVAHYAIDGIGMSLADDFWRLGFSHPRELVGLTAQQLARRMEDARERRMDVSYLRALEAAVAGVERAFGAPTGPRSTLEPAKPKLKPLPGGTKRAQVMKRPYPATIDQVRVTREGGTAILEYAEPGVSTVHFQIGARLPSMTDEDVIALHNGTLEAMEDLRLGSDLPLLEMPVGVPQIEWYDRGHQWSARGHVLRCLIDSGDEEGPSVIIDDKELTWAQFGKVVASFGGWGLRAIFVDHDSLHEEPHIEVREPDGKRRR